MIPIWFILFCSYLHHVNWVFYNLNFIIASACSNSQAHPQTSFKHIETLVPEVSHTQAAFCVVLEKSVKNTLKLENLVTTYFYKNNKYGNINTVFFNCLQTSYKFAILSPTNKIHICIYFTLDDIGWKSDHICKFQWKWTFQKILEQTPLIFISYLLRHCPVLPSVATTLTAAWLNHACCFQ